MKPKVAIVRGKFLNKYEMQFFEPLVQDYDLTAFGSRTSFHSSFAFPAQQLYCPLDLPEFPYKMPILNRVFTDAHYLYGLEKALTGFDLVHTAETYFRYTAQCLKAKKQGRVKHVIATVLENIPFNNEGIHGRKELKEHARRELDHIIALTERTKLALLLEGAEEKKITVISHFIDTKRFFPDENKKYSNTIRILFCGRLEEYKGVYELVSAIKLLRQDSELKQFKLLCTFVGGGSQESKLIDREKLLGIEENIEHSVSTYDNMPEQYRSCDMYVAPSKETLTWQEQYNTSLLEAQASGLPIVTTYSGGIPENVGDAAIMANPGDVYSLYEAMKKLILDEKLRKDLGIRARKRAETVHDIRHGAKKIGDLYHEFL